MKKAQIKAEKKQSRIKRLIAEVKHFIKQKSPEVYMDDLITIYGRQKTWIYEHILNEPEVFVLWSACFGSKKDPKSLQLKKARMANSYAENENSHIKKFRYIEKNLQGTCVDISQHPNMVPGSITNQPQIAISQSEVKNAQENNSENLFTESNSDIESIMNGVITTDSGSCIAFGSNY
jgi:hypothetical protein